MYQVLFCGLIFALLLTIGESFRDLPRRNYRVSHVPVRLAGKPGTFPDPKNTRGGNGKPSYADPEIADIGWGPAGSLIRQGPVPFFIRIVKPDTYEAAVAKYMAQEKCDRATAQGNMDAYFQDPNGWAGNKLRERKTGINIDYVNQNTDPSSLILTAIWSSGFFFLCYKIFEVQVLNK